MEKKKPNRTRKIPIQIYVDDEEFEIIENNRKRAKIKNKSDYIRQMIVFGNVVSFDDADLKNCYDELHRIGVNLNQMAKVANQTNDIYKEDINMIKEGYSHINEYLNAVYMKLDEVLKLAKNEKTETRSELIRRIYDSTEIDDKKKEV